MCFDLLNIRDVIVDDVVYDPNDTCGMKVLFENSKNNMKLIFAMSHGIT